jgi:hypothetical protein
MGALTQATQDCGDTAKASVDFATL